MNANQLAVALGMDYKTIRHHLKVLEENDMLSVVKRDDYGAMYFLSSLLENNYSDFEEVWSQIGNKEKNMSEVEGESYGRH